MRCERIRDHGERYADGDTSVAMRAKIDAHLASCEKCRKVYDSITATRALFAETTLPAVPEGIFVEVPETIRIRNGRNKRQFDIRSHVTDWWFKAAPGVRVAYALVLAVLTAGGIYMGRDLWKNGTTANAATGYDNDYPGINVFATMSPGSVEQTYFKLTSYGTERGGK